MKTLKSVANPSHAELSVKLPSPPRPRGPQPSHQCSARSGGTFPVLAALVLLAVFSTNIARAVDFHCVTAQDLQNALTLPTEPTTVSTLPMDITSETSTTTVPGIMPSPFCLNWA